MIPTGYLLVLKSNVIGLIWGKTLLQTRIGHCVEELEYHQGVDYILGAWCVDSWDVVHLILVAHLCIVCVVVVVVVAAAAGDGDDGDGAGDWWLSWC